MSFIKAEKRGHTAVWTLLGSGSASLLSVYALRDLHRNIDGVSEDSETSAIIITGGNYSFFSAGADLHELAALDGDASLLFSRLGQCLFDKMELLPKPIIAAVDGYCMGGGLDLLLACDLRYATPESTFAHPGSRFGIITGFGGTVRLPVETGRAKACDLFMTARKVDAEEALEIGLINSVIDSKFLLERCLEIADGFEEVDQSLFRSYKNGAARGLF